MIIESKDYVEMEDLEYEEDEEIEKNLNDKKQENPIDKLQIRGPGQKQKRRSKNDYKGRNFKCGCGKTYLSYPALYTHIKTKHNGKMPDGTNANQEEKKVKGRGRPRKNFLMNEDSHRKRTINNQNEELHPELKKLYGKEGVGCKSFKQRESDYLKIYKALSDSIDPIEYLSYTIEELFSYRDFNDNKNLEIFDLIKKWEKEKLDYVIESKRKKFTEEIMLKNKQLTCDDCIALFIIDYKEVVRIEVMKLFVIYFYHLRAYLNKLGWDFICEVEGNLLRYPTHKDFSKTSAY